MTRSVPRYCALFGGFLVWCSAAAAAPGDATRLEYARSDRAASCPDQSALKAAVVKRLGYDPFFPAARQTIVVEITNVESGLRAQLHLIDENGIIRGSRELRESSEHCDELVAALALAISIALDPSAAMGAAPESASVAPDAPASLPSENADSVGNTADPEPPPTAPAPVPHAKKRAPPPKQPSQARSAVPIGLRATLFGVVGAAPAPALGFRVGPSAHWAWFKLSAELSEQFAASSNTQPLGGSAKASILEGKLAPCFAFAQNSLAACGLLGVGALRSEGQGIDNPSRQSNWNVTLGGRFEYTPRLAGPLHLLLNADVNRSLTPITLRLRGETAWKTPFLSAALGAGVELHFP